MKTKQEVAQEIENLLSQNNMALRVIARHEDYEERPYQDVFLMDESDKNTMFPDRKKGVILLRG